MRQNGFAHILMIFLFTVVVFIVSFGGWLFWTNQQAYKNSTDVIYNERKLNVSDMTVESSPSEVLSADRLSIITIIGDQLDTIYQQSLETGGSYGGFRIIQQNDSIVYFADRVKITKLDLVSRISNVVYENKNTEKDIVNFSFSPDEQHIYITFQGKDSRVDGDLELVDYTLVNSQSRTVADFKPVMYGNKSYLMNVNGVDVVASFGGDGCGGFGEIYKVVNNKLVKLIETGGGCSIGPVFLKADPTKNSLLFYSLIKDRSNRPGYYSQIDQIYWLNVLTGQKTVVMNFNPAIDNNSMELNDQLNEVVFNNGKELVFIDLINGEVKSKLPVVASYSPSYWFGKYLYAGIYGESAQVTGSVLDLEMGKFNNFEIPRTLQSFGRQASMFGGINGKLLYYVIDPKTKSY